MGAKKVTKGNHLPGKDDDRFVVYSKQFNEAIDYINDTVGTPGTGEFDIISEETAGAGVTADGVLLKDGLVKPGNGTVALPAYTFASDVDSGVYRIGANNIGVAVNATKILDVATTGLTVVGSVVSGAGTVSAPGSVVGANDNGFYEISATQLGASVSNTLVGGFNASGLFTDVVAEQTSTVGVTVDGALIKDGSFVGKQATATATAAGLTTGALTGADQFVTVTSASANDVICLPLDANCPIGTKIRGWVGANGFELRSNATDVTATINNVTAGTTNEAAIPATTLFEVQKVASLTWILTATDEVGAVVTAIIPDAV